MLDLDPMIAKLVAALGRREPWSVEELEPLRDSCSELLGRLTTSEDASTALSSLTNVDDESLLELLCGMRLQTMLCVMRADRAGKVMSRIAAIQPEVGTVSSGYLAGIVHRLEAIGRISAIRTIASPTRIRACTAVLAGAAHE